MGISLVGNSPLAGEIWLGKFGNPMLGEVWKIRPFLVLAPIHEFDRAQSYVTLVPFSSKERKYRYHHAVFPSQTNGLTQMSWAACNQIVSTKRNQLLERIGVVDTDHWFAIKDFIAEYLGL